MKCAPAILVYGFGNPGREDDGAGIALAERIEAAALPGVAVETNYQLNVEDALLLCGYDAVIFADASRNPIGQFLFRRLTPASIITFTTHAMQPESVLALSQQLYQAAPAAYLLELGGTSYDLREVLTAEAAKNIAAAGAFLLKLLRQPSIADFEAAASLHYR